MTNRYIGPAWDRTFVHPFRKDGKKAWRVYLGMIGNGNVSLGEIVKVDDGFEITPVFPRDPRNLVNVGRLDESRTARIFAPNLPLAVSALKALETVESGS